MAPGLFIQPRTTSAGERWPQAMPDGAALGARGGGPGPTAGCRRGRCGSGRAQGDHVVAVRLWAAVVSRASTASGASPADPLRHWSARPDPPSAAARRGSRAWPTAPSSSLRRSVGRGRMPAPPGCTPGCTAFFAGLLGGEAGRRGLAQGSRPETRCSPTVGDSRVSGGCDALVDGDPPGALGARGVRVPPCRRRGPGRRGREPRVEGSGRGTGRAAHRVDQVEEAVRVGSRHPWVSSPVASWLPRVRSPVRCRPVRPRIPGPARAASTPCGVGSLGEQQHGLPLGARGCEA